MCIRDRLNVDETITLEQDGQYRMQVYARAGGSFFFGQNRTDNSEVTLNLDWTLTEPGA